VTAPLALTAEKNSNGQRHEDADAEVEVAV